MNVYQWLCLLGIPAISSAFIGYLIGAVIKLKRDNKAVKLGVQALLRSQMIRDFNKYSYEGEAPLFAKENFENCWEQYHALGANGVMDEIHEQFLKLPINNKNQKG